MKNNWVEESQVKKSKLDSSRASSKQQKDLDAEEVQKMLTKPLNLTSEELMDEAMAFDKFRNSSRRFEAMQKNTKILEQKMMEGKQIGKIAN